MAEITILGCDGCLKAATARRPVDKVSIYGETVVPDTLEIDVHDMECIRRYFSRTNKASRDAAKAAKAAENKPAKKR